VVSSAPIPPADAQAPSITNLLAERCCFGMAYDRIRQQIVLFGGKDLSNVANNDTYVWNWDTSSWVQKAPSASPCARYSTRMAWDGSKIVLFGGVPGNGCPPDQNPLRDTWLWDGTTWTQCVTQTCIPPNSPLARSSQGMSPDEATNQVVMFGGNPAGGGGGLPEETDAVPNALGDTWLWTGGTTQSWTRCQPCSPSPSGRGSPGMAHHVERSSVTLFGGVSGTQIQADTWFWKNGKWTKCNDAQCNSAGLSRSSHRVDYDTVNSQVILFGGKSTACLNPDNLCNDTWGLDGGDWSKCGPPTGCLTPPTPPRCCGGVAFDRSRNLLLMFGGQKAGHIELGDAWMWEPVTRVWTCILACT
jgi:hypothetical protein